MVIEDQIDLPTETANDDMSEPEKTMTLVEHLEELRKRIIFSAIAILAGSILAFIFREPILHFLLTPLPSAAEFLGGGQKLVVTGIGEGFTVYLKLSVAVGVVIASPVVLYEVWAYVAPGLTRKERKLAGPFVLIGTVLFFAGIAVGFLTLRYPIDWLINFGKGNFLELITASNYFTFIAFFLLAFGIIFELPLVLTLMAALGMVSSGLLRKRRPAALALLWIISGFITPGTDPYSPVIIGVALTILYEISIILIRVIGK